MKGFGCGNPEGGTYLGWGREYLPFTGGTYLGRGGGKGTYLGQVMP